MKVSLESVVDVRNIFANGVGIMPMNVEMFIVMNGEI